MFPNYEEEITVEEETAYNCNGIKEYIVRANKDRLWSIYNKRTPVCVRQEEEQEERVWVKMLYTGQKLPHETIHSHDLFFPPLKNPSHLLKSNREGVSRCEQCVKGLE